MKILVIVFCMLLSFAECAFPQSPKQMRRFMQSGPSPANAIPYGNNPKTGHYANAGDAKIYYEVYGKGQPIVVLHGGLFGSMMEMASFIDRLSKNYKVIAVSTRGHGKSELGSAQLTYEQRANDVLAVIRAEASDSVIVLGFSDGGYAGYKLANMYPAVVKKLIAIGAAERVAGETLIDVTVKDARTWDSAYWKQQLSLMPEPARLEEMFTTVSNFYNHLSVGKETFEKINCPVLVMVGDRDHTVSAEHAVNAARMLKNSQISIIPNCSHVVFLENFSAVWECIAPFLKE